MDSGFDVRCCVTSRWGRQPRRAPTVRAKIPPYESRGPKNVHSVERNRPDRASVAAQMTPQADLRVVEAHPCAATASEATTKLNAIMDYIKATPAKERFHLEAHPRGRRQRDPGGHQDHHRSQGRREASCEAVCRGGRAYRDSVGAREGCGSETASAGEEGEGWARVGELSGHSD